MLLTNATLAMMTDTTGNTAYGLVEDGAIAIRDGLIAWAGPRAELPPAHATLAAHDLQGRLITPAPIDCHTHIIHGGNRAAEFEMRLKGASYEDIARAGGGILSTVKATRASSEAQLLADALPRIDALLAEGVSLIEIKSGYGLDIDTELSMLRVAREIERCRPVRIRTTFLGAHAIPPEYADTPDAYIDEVCIPALYAAHQEGLVDAVDGFCEGIAFNVSQIERVMKEATHLDLPIKLHTDQLSNMGGIALAAHYKALSVDHLEYATLADVQAMAASDMVAVLLPGAFYFLRETQLPPMAALRQHGVPIALATDNNPGSSPVTSLLLTMNMACTLFRMTPEEALAGITCNAAKALGLNDTGMIKAGLRADLAIWDVSHPAALSYHIGFNPLHKRIFGGSF